MLPPGPPRWVLRQRSAAPARGGATQLRQWHVSVAVGRSMYYTCTAPAASSARSLQMRRGVGFSMHTYLAPKCTPSSSVQCIAALSTAVLLALLGVLNNNAKRCLSPLQLQTLSCMVEKFCVQSMPLLGL